MAVWQYDLFFVGEGKPLPLLGDDGWECPQLSAASTLAAQQILVGSLGCPWLMMDDWVVFGDEQATRVDLCFDDAGNVEIGIRLLPSATEPELDTLCAFAAALHGRFFDPARRTLIQADRNALGSALATSAAAAFCRAPRSNLPPAISSWDTP